LYSIAQSLVARIFVFSTATPRLAYLSQTAEVLQEQLGGVLDAGKAEVDNTMSFVCNLGTLAASFVKRIFWIPVGITGTHGQSGSCRVKVERPGVTVPNTVGW
jgi:hypothetical protein